MSRLPRDMSDFAFVSPRAYLMISMADHGSLQIFTFEDSDRSLPVHAVTLNLPDVIAEAHIEHMDTHCSPFFTHAPPNRLFVASPNSRIHVIHVLYRTFESQFTKLLFVPTRDILRFLQTYHSPHVLIPWSLWGRRTCFMDKHFPFFWLRYLTFHAY